MKQVYRLLRAGLQLTIGVTLLALLTPATPLESQSILAQECCRGSTEPLDDFGILTSDKGLTYTEGISPTATIGQNDNFPSEFPAAALPLDLSDISEVRSGESSSFGWSSSAEDASSVAAERQNLTDSDKPNEDSTPVMRVQNSKPVDLNRNIYYRNKLEFSFETGYHPINIPFVYDFAVGDGYNMTPLRYTLVPIIAALRWHVSDIGGRWIFRGNFDFTFSGSVTIIPKGPETRYLAFIFGIRRNFVHRNWRVVPYFEEQGGIGNIDAKEPLGVQFAQGENLTFTYNMGTGVRYDLNPRYSISAGMNYMHISNGYLSQPTFTNYGINVYGPKFGINVRLGKPRHDASE